MAKVSFVTVEAEVVDRISQEQLEALLEWAIEGEVGVTIGPQVEEEEYHNGE